MRYTIDKERRTVDFYIEDGSGGEARHGMTFAECEELLMDLMRDLSAALRESLRERGEI